MSEQATAMPISDALFDLQPLGIDDAVRAALRHRSTEARSFRNEDDMEGAGSDMPDVRLTAPAP